MAQSVKLVLEMSLLQTGAPALLCRIQLPAHGLGKTASDGSRTRGLVMQDPGPAMAILQQAFGE